MREEVRRRVSVEELIRQSMLSGGEGGDVDDDWDTDTDTARQDEGVGGAHVGTTTGSSTHTTTTTSSSPGITTASASASANAGVTANGGTSVGAIPQSKWRGWGMMEEDVSALGSTLAINVREAVRYSIRKKRMIYQVLLSLGAYYEVTRPRPRHHWLALCVSFQFAQSQSHKLQFALFAFFTVLLCGRCVASDWDSMWKISTIRGRKDLAPRSARFAWLE